MERGTTQNHLNLSKASRFSVNSIQGPSLVMEMKKGESDNLEQKSKWRSWTRHYNPLILNFNVCSTVLVLGRCKLLSQFLHWPSLWFWRHRKGGRKGTVLFTCCALLNQLFRRKASQVLKENSRKKFLPGTSATAVTERNTYLALKKKKKKTYMQLF